MYAKYQLHKANSFWGEDFQRFFFENLPFLGPKQPIKISDQNEGHLKLRALLNKHFSKNNVQLEFIFYVKTDVSPLSTCMS